MGLVELILDGHVLQETEGSLSDGRAMINSVLERTQVNRLDELLVDRRLSESSVHERLNVALQQLVQVLVRCNLAHGLNGSLLDLDLRNTDETQQDRHKFGEALSVFVLVCTVFERASAGDLGQKVIAGQGLQEVLLHSLRVHNVQLANGLGDDVADALLVTVGLADVKRQQNIDVLSKASRLNVNDLTDSADVHELLLSGDLADEVEHTRQEERSVTNGDAAEADGSSLSNRIKLILEHVRDNLNDVLDARQ